MDSHPIVGLNSIFRNMEYLDFEAWFDNLSKLDGLAEAAKLTASENAGDSNLQKEAINAKRVAERAHEEIRNNAAGDLEIEGDDVLKLETFVNQTIDDTVNPHFKGRASTAGSSGGELRGITSQGDLFKLVSEISFDYQVGKATVTIPSGWRTATILLFDPNRNMLVVRKKEDGKIEEPGGKRLIKGDPKNKKGVKKKKEKMIFLEKEPYATLKRELFEETGLKLVDVNLHSQFYNAKYECVVYVGKITKVEPRVGPTRRNDSVVACEWIPWAELEHRVDLGKRLTAKSKDIDPTDLSSFEAAAQGISDLISDFEKKSTFQSEEKSNDTFRKWIGLSYRDMRLLRCKAEHDGSFQAKRLLRNNEFSGYSDEVNHTGWSAELESFYGLISSAMCQSVCYAPGFSDVTEHVTRNRERLQRVADSMRSVMVGVDVRTLAKNGIKDLFTDDPYLSVGDEKREDDRYYGKYFMDYGWCGALSSAYNISRVSARLAEYVGTIQKPNKKTSRRLVTYDGIILVEELKHEPQMSKIGVGSLSCPAIGQEGLSSSSGLHLAVSAQPNTLKVFLKQVHESPYVRAWVPINGVRPRIWGATQTTSASIANAGCVLVDFNNGEPDESTLFASLRISRESLQFSRVESVLFNSSLSNEYIIRFNTSVVGYYDVHKEFMIAYQAFVSLIKAQIQKCLSSHNLDGLDWSVLSEEPVRILQGNKSSDDDMSADMINEGIFGGIIHGVAESIAMFGMNSDEVCGRIVSATDAKTALIGLLAEGKILAMSRSSGKEMESPVVKLFTEVNGESLKNVTDPVWDDWVEGLPARTRISAPGGVFYGGRDDGVLGTKLQQLFRGHLEIEGKDIFYSLCDRLMRRCVLNVMSFGTTYLEGSADDLGNLNAETKLNVLMSNMELREVMSFDYVPDGDSGVGARREMWTDLCQSMGTVVVSTTAANEPIDVHFQYYTGYDFMIENHFGIIDPRNDYGMTFPEWCHADKETSVRSIQFGEQSLGEVAGRVISFFDSDFHELGELPSEGNGGNAHHVFSAMQRLFVKTIVGTADSDNTAEGEKMEYSALNDPAAKEIWVYFVSTINRYGEIFFSSRNCDKSRAFKKKSFNELSRRMRDYAGTSPPITDELAYTGIFKILAMYLSLHQVTQWFGDVALSRSTAKSKFKLGSSDTKFSVKGTSYVVKRSWPDDRLASQELSSKQDSLVNVRVGVSHRSELPILRRVGPSWTQTYEHNFTMLVSCMVMRLKSNAVKSWNLASKDVNNRNATSFDMKCLVDL